MFCCKIRFDEVDKRIICNYSHIHKMINNNNFVFFISCAYPSALFRRRWTNLWVLFKLLLGQQWAIRNYNNFRLFFLSGFFTFLFFFVFFFWLGGSHTINCRYYINSYFIWIYILLLYLVLSSANENSRNNWPNRKKSN